MMVLVCWALSGFFVSAEEADDSGIHNFTDESMPEDFSGENVAVNHITPARIITGDEAKNCDTRLVLIGTTGGISWYPETDRASSSSVLIVQIHYQSVTENGSSIIRIENVNLID